nr:serine/threonine-protein kinase SBK1-like [Procambarus clarkii]XP_045600474.1 serine/threonine-protein kinase SBK1-like [Procambarus clarkii]
MSGNGSGSFQSMKTGELPRVEVERQYSDVRLLAESSGVQVFSARPLQPGASCVALKCLHKDTTKKKDFLREFNYNLNLDRHLNIVSCFAASETFNSYVLTQELAPMGDLSNFVKKAGLKQQVAKRVIEQVTNALEFMHKENLVHRDVCLENILVFDRELSRVKLGDFGSTQEAGALVKKLKVRSPWAPPEVSVAVYNEGYHVHSGQDAWQLGILIFLCLTGSHPWSSADITDRHYNSWVAWLKRKTTKVPLRFTCFTPRLLRLLRRLLEPKPEKRAGVKEVYKYLSDPWLLEKSRSVDTSVNNASAEVSISCKKSLFTRSENKLVEIIRSYITHYRSLLQQKTACPSSDVKGGVVPRDVAPVLRDASPSIGRCCLGAKRCCYGRRRSFHSVTRCCRGVRRDVRSNTRIET